MHNLLSSLALGLTLASSLISPLTWAQASTADAATKPAAATSKAHILTNAEFDALRAKPEQLLIVDVRRPDELTEIGGFPVYLSVQLAQLEASTAWIPKDRKIVVVSNHAGRGGKGADLLAAKGFKVVGAIGAQTYEQDGGTLSKIVKPAPRVAQNTAAAADAK